MRNAENSTPTWLRFQQLDSALGETATSSNQGRVNRIPILQTLSQLQDTHRFHKNLQSSSEQFQVAKLPVQRMPFPQYVQHCRIRILHLGNPGHPPGPPKEHNLKAWTTRTLILNSFIYILQTFIFHKGRCDMDQSDTIGKIELIPFSILSRNITNCKNDIQ